MGFTFPKCEVCGLPTDHAARMAESLDRCDKQNRELRRKNRIYRRQIGQLQAKLALLRAKAAGVYLPPVPPVPVVDPTGRVDLATLPITTRKSWSKDFGEFGESTTKKED